MNYSKKGLKQKQQKLNSKSEKFGRKIVFLACQVLLLFAVVGVIMVGSAAIGAFEGCIDNAPDIDSSDVAAEGFSSFVYDKD